MLLRREMSTGIACCAGTAAGTEYRRNAHPPSVTFIHDFNKVVKQVLCSSTWKLTATTTWKPRPSAWTWDAICKALCVGSPKRPVLFVKRIAIYDALQVAGPGPFSIREFLTSQCAETNCCHLLALADFSKCPSDTSQILGPIDR